VITGSEFHQNTEAGFRCKFVFDTSDYIVIATIINTERVVCRTPNTSSLYSFTDTEKKGELIVSQADGVFYNDYREIVYSFRDPVIDTITPAYGYVNERSGITIKGNYIRNKKKLYIRFTFEGKTESVKPIYIDSSTVFLQIPETFELFTYLHTYPASVSIDLTNNSQEYSNSLVFTYYNMPQLFSITPNL
jgi:hypothetical protein